MFNPKIWKPAIASLAILTVALTSVFITLPRSGEVVRDKTRDVFSEWVDEVTSRAATAPAVQAEMLLAVTSSKLSGEGTLAAALTTANNLPTKNIRIEFDDRLSALDEPVEIPVSRLVVAPRRGSLMIDGRSTKANRGGCVVLHETFSARIKEILMFARPTYTNKFACALAGRKWLSRVNLVSSTREGALANEGLYAFDIKEGANLTLRDLSIVTVNQKPSMTIYNSGNLSLNNVAITVAGHSNCALNTGYMIWNESSCSVHDTSVGLESAGDKNRQVLSILRSSLIANHGESTGILATAAASKLAIEIDSSLLVTTGYGTAVLSSSVDNGFFYPITLRHSSITGCDALCKTRYQ